MHPDRLWETPRAGGTPQTDRLEANPSRVGQLLDGKYELVRKIGEGGMGEVYEARHSVLGRRFAVKLLHPEFIRSNRMLRRFSRESLSTSRLEHAHVVSVLDCGDADDGTPYFVMEFLRGHDLRRALRESGPLSAPRAVRLMTQACRGIQAAHELGLVHRDLKPENLFVELRDGAPECVKVLDFGVVQTGGGNSTSHTGSMVGTFRYMAPEQARGDARLDPRADVYALGAILYECLTGVVPHQGRNTEEVLFRIMTEDPAPLRDLNPDLDIHLEATVLRSLRRDPEERFQTADDLAAALSTHARRHLASVPIDRFVASEHRTSEAETVGNSSAMSPRLRRKFRVHPTKRHLVWAAVILSGAVALHFVDRVRLVKPPRAASARLADPADSRGFETAATSHAPERTVQTPSPPPVSATSAATANPVPGLDVRLGGSGLGPQPAPQTRKNVLRGETSVPRVIGRPNDYGANLDSKNPYDPL